MLPRVEKPHGVTGYSYANFGTWRIVMADRAALCVGRHRRAVGLIPACSVAAGFLIGLVLTGDPAAMAQQSQPSPCTGDNGGITLSPGFCATVFADNLGHVRQMAFGPNGVLYVDVAERLRPDLVHPVAILQPYAHQSAVIALVFNFWRETDQSRPGSIATFTSRTILPVSSTMQTLVSLTETSSPAKWSMLHFSF
jgi:hypothetical protein